MASSPGRPEVKFDWFIPIDGDGARAGTWQAERPPSFDYLTQVAQTAEEWAGALREKTPAGLRHMKALIHSSRDVPLAEGLDLEESVFLDYARHDDVRGGRLAFKEKTKPQY